MLTISIVAYAIILVNTAIVSSIREYYCNCCKIFLYYFYGMRVNRIHMLLISFLIYDIAIFSIGYFVGYTHDRTNHIPTPAKIIPFRLGHDGLTNPLLEYKISQTY